VTISILLYAFRFFIAHVPHIYTFVFSVSLPRPSPLYGSRKSTRPDVENTFVSRYLSKKRRVSEYFYVSRKNIPNFIFGSEYVEIGGIVSKVFRRVLIVTTRWLKSVIKLRFVRYSLTELAVGEGPVRYTDP